MSQSPFQPGHWPRRGCENHFSISTRGASSLLNSLAAPLSVFIYSTKSKPNQGANTNMKQYLTFREKVLLLLYYCIRLAFQLLPARKHAFPQVVQSSEQPQAYSVSFPCEQFGLPIYMRLMLALETSGFPKRSNCRDPRRGQCLLGLASWHQSTCGAPASGC